MRLVKIARNVDETSIVAEGLQAGETLVTDGQQRLGPGAKVEVKEPGARNPEPGTRTPGHAAP